MVTRKLAFVLTLFALVALSSAAMASPKGRYERAVAQQRDLRLDGSRPSPLSHIRRTIALYEDVVRRYPASAYADNALWQAAQLALAAHRLHASELDRERGMQFLRRLVTQYPSSSLRSQAREALRQADAPVARRAGAAERPSRVAAEPSRSVIRESPAPPPPPSNESVSVPRAPSVATLRDIRRENVGGLVRVTLEFEGEAAYRHEELANPARLYFDLPDTEVAAPLVDARITFEGPGIRQIRLGRPRRQTTRVVMDLDSVARYSIFTLYNPYRLTIDLHPSASPVTDVASLAGAQPRLEALGAPVAGPRVSERMPDPPRLTPRPLPHPLANRPVSAARPVTSVRVPVPAPTPLLIGRSLSRLSRDVMIVPLGRPLAREFAVAEVADRMARAAVLAKPLLARRAAIAPTQPAPMAPVPNGAGGFSLARQLGLGVSRIVIDPGHGGHDPGALGPRVTEAEVVLDVALRLEKLLEKEPGFEVVLTRRNNVFVSLEERTAIANRESADLFLSIHANSSRNRRATGVETYFLNFATNPEAEAVAARENAGAGRTMHNLPEMVRAIALNNKLDESRDLAKMVQHALVETLQSQNRELRDLGVKQAPFVVLIGAAMPSVLAEIAFISNASESQLLKSNGYRQRIAQALLEAIKSYRETLKAVGTVATWAHPQ